jgi:AcrR family transcriptional regulator
MANAPTKGPTGSSERAKERYAKRRNELIDVAAQVFAKRGYHATTIDDLVEATQLQRGGLYHYIGGKKDLLLSIHERFIEPLLEETNAIVADDGPADVKLRRAAHVLMQTINDFRDQVTVFLHEWRVIEDDPEWSEIREGRRTFEKDIAEILEQGRREGIFQFADVRLTVLAFLGMLNYTYQWFDPTGRVTPDAVADYFCDIFLRGIVTPGE